MPIIDTAAFNAIAAKKPTVQKDTDVIFVCDFFADDLIGGAELSTEALLQSTNLNVVKVRSAQVSIALLEEYQSKYWIFTNISRLNQDVILTIANNIKYSCVIYDYSFCKYRSLEKHKYAEQVECNCSNEFIGKLMSTFMFRADSLWFMSEEQMSIWIKHFPFLANKDITVLSSIFDEEFFVKCAELKKRLKDGNIVKDEKYIVLDSTSWIKGTDAAKQHCIDNNIEMKLIGGLQYDEMLETLAKSKGLVYLPPGSDTCPRLTIEAKLLGCDLILNDFVQHKNEEWFDTDELEITVSYLYMCRERFWNGIKHVMSYRPTISGYTTTYNCINNDYPYIESITSLLRFCDEVIVVDAGSTDETLKQLKKLAEKEDKLKVFQKKVDFSKPRWAVEIDGHLKAYARALCKAQFCWQQDSDEVVHEEDYEKIYKLVKNFPKSVSIICLPVIEYFGSVDKVRSDVAWKWRLSRNLPEITHDVPLHYREFDSDGNVYPQPFKSDTCDYVDVNSYLPIKTATFYPAEADIVRQSNIEEYEKWFDKVIQTYPSVFHFSWLKIERKVRNYLGNRGWQSFHASMFNLSENTPMFDHAPTEDEIKQKVKEIKEHGPHIFHRKMSDETKGKVKTISVSRTIPEIVKDWVNK